MPSAAYLRKQAETCLRRAMECESPMTAERLRLRAAEFKEKADDIEAEEHVDLPGGRAPREPRQAGDALRFSHGRRNPAMRKKSGLSAIQATPPSRTDRWHGRSAYRCGDEQPGRRRDRRSRCALRSAALSRVGGRRPKSHD